MRIYWTKVTDPDNVVAVALNTYPKHVVSTTLSNDEAGWENTAVIREDPVGTGDFVVQDGKEASVRQ